VPPIYGQIPGNYYHGLLSTPACSQCPLQNDTKVLPDGPIPAPIAFVGEEPGDTERAEGRGFLGPSGQLLWHMAAQVGVTRDMVWTTNGSLCKARKIVLQNGAVLPYHIVKPLAAQACRIRLLQEMLLVQPTVIVPVGNWALWALSDIPKARIYAYRGARIDISIAALLNRVQAGLSRAPIRQIKSA
jgi:uracil-DNA glycosylase family 4